MSYHREILVKTLLNRHWRMSSEIVRGICIYLPRPHFDSYLSVRWNLNAFYCTEPWRLHPDRVLETGLWLRYHGPHENNPDVLSLNELRDEPYWRLNRLVNVRKAMRLACAVMSIGFTALTLPSIAAKVVEDNFELVRLLSQGPWYQLRDKKEHRRRSADLALQLKFCFRMLVDAARFQGLHALKDHNHNAMRDIYRLESMFVEVENVLKWARVMKANLGDDPWYFDVPLYFATVPFLGSVEAELYYMGRPV
jgi:hypothetical protein